MLLTASVWHEIDQSVGVGYVLSYDLYRYMFNSSVYECCRQLKNCFRFISCRRQIADGINSTYCDMIVNLW